MSPDYRGTHQDRMTRTYEGSVYAHFLKFGCFTRGAVIKVDLTCHLLRSRVLGERETGRWRDFFICGPSIAAFLL